MKVRLLKKWKSEHAAVCVGAVIDIPSSQAKRLVHLGRVEIVDNIETAALSAGRERQNDRLKGERPK